MFFCQKHNIYNVEITKNYVTSRNREIKVTNQCHYEVEVFNTIVDMLIIEFGEKIL